MPDDRDREFKQLRSAYKRYDVVAYDEDEKIFVVVSSIFSKTAAFSTRDELARRYPRVVIWKGCFSFVYDPTPIKLDAPGHHNHAPVDSPPEAPKPPILVGRSYVGCYPKYDHLGQVEFRTIIDIVRVKDRPDDLVRYSGNGVFTKTKMGGARTDTLRRFNQWVGAFHDPDSGPAAAPHRKKLTR